MANEKILNTRISLKYDTLAKWQASAFNGTDSTKYLKAGEVAIVTVGSDVETNHPTNASNQHPLLFKVGDGVHKFDDLAWASALAADVYDWAKQSENDFVSKFFALKMTDGTTMQSKLDGVFATDAELAKAIGDLQAIFADYYTKEEIDETIEIVENSINGVINRVITLENEEKTYGDIVTHNVAEFATAAQGDKADKAAAKEEVDAALALRYTKEETNSAISTAIGTRTTYTNEQIDGKVEAVLGTSTDAATANTVYGAKAAAAAAQSDATTAKTKIEAFLGAITPDGTAEAIDTLAEIQKYMTDDTAAFTQLSAKVTNIENGDTATTAGDLTAELEAEIKGYTVAKATNAVDAEKLGGQAPNYYATAASVTAITESNGVIDTKIANKADKVSGAVAGNLAALDENGNLTDSGKKAADFQLAGNYLNSDGTNAANKFEMTAMEGITLDADNADITLNADNVIVSGTLKHETYGAYALAKDIPTSTDDIQAGTETWIFNCGTSTTVI